MLCIRPLALGPVKALFSNAVRTYDVIRFTCLTVPLFTRKANWCAGTPLSFLTYGTIRVNRHFSKSFHNNNSILTSL